MNAPKAAYLKGAATNRQRGLERARTLLLLEAEWQDRGRLCTFLGVTPGSLRTMLYRARRRVAEAEK